nr:MAG: ORF1 [TTV-like mini virus]
MPWRYYRRPWRRRHWYRYRRPRKTFRRRYWWRRKQWVRPYKKRKIVIKQYQPKSIRRCAIKGFLSLFQATQDRLSFNFDSYELSTVPEKLPGGGGWGIKAISLEALYSEHEYAHNLWTVSNREMPLCRYFGCTVKLFQSRFTDYVFSYCTQLPLQSSLAMYNTMQPSIHMMLYHKVIVPSTETYKKKRPYFKIRIPPPTQLQNKWYFQQDLAKTPLVMFRTTACSLQQYYINDNSINSNITIITLNTGLIKNRNYQKPFTSGYYANTHPTLGKIYLYSTREIKPITDIKTQDLIFLGDSNKYTQGSCYTDIYPTQAGTKWDEFKSNNIKYWGNPFHTEYLTGNEPVYQSQESYPQILNKGYNSKVESLTLVQMTHKLRYNPYADQGNHNQCYFLSNAKQEEGWDPPDNPELTNEGLPLWILIWGFADYHIRIKKHLHLNTDYQLVITQDATRPIRNYLVPLGISFYNGHSPYEPDNKPDPDDTNRWHPSLQYQVEAINDILMCGPGTAKSHKDFSLQAHLQYKFRFNWGGNPPKMSQIEDPKTQTTYPLPGNRQSTNSLQNPAGPAESLLYSFDQRRGEITQKALARMQKDHSTPTTFISDGSRFQEPIPVSQTSTPEESSSEEEEEETLFDKLQRQRHKQQQLKLRILKTLKKLQKLE